MSADLSKTPMVRQYWELRNKLPPNTLLFFRVGDFYEMFGPDAERGAELLGLTLTQRAGAPLAGVPYHAIQTYLQKALGAGVKIAICEQAETPKPGKLVKRELVRIITPGTTLEEAQLDARHNNYILAIDDTRAGLHAAWLDVSTGEFRIASSREREMLLAALQALRPSEVLVPESWRQGSTPKYLEPLLQWNLVSRVDDWQFDAKIGCGRVCEVLKVRSLAGFGIGEKHPALGAAGALLNYVTATLCETPSYIKKISELRSGESLIIDVAGTRNLELFKSAAGTRDGSLLAAIDGTHTAAGARLLERWLASPSRNVEIIRNRQNCVEAFFKSNTMTARVLDAIAGIKDIARTITRLQNRLRSPRGLGAIRDSLGNIPALKAAVELVSPSPLDAVNARIDPHEALRAELDKMLVNELPVDMPGVIRAGCDAELDRLRNLRSDSQNWIASFENQLRQETEIRNLRVRYTGTFGYYIEVTKSNLDKVPQSWIRRQTLVNAERYTTPELREKESEILHADELVARRESELFEALVAKVLAAADSLKETAGALAELDVFAGWAQLAKNWDYCKPEVDDSDVLQIVDGRHPVVEQMLQRAGTTQSFVPNSTDLAAAGTQINIITGPNMAGKSTYIRQVALIVLLAQIGCWVPARAARIGVADRIFCRVGASDELARGNSTFMVEMNETANILNNATPKSLVILDEIGRGTSTYDGLSIAWSVAEFLHGNGSRGPRTLFATHYHELTRIADELPRVKNYCVAVKEWNDEIIFVRTVVPGAADRSYGIHVARLAGLPDAVIRRAKEILADLERSNDDFRRDLPLLAHDDDDAEDAPETAEESKNFGNAAPTETQPETTETTETPGTTETTETTGTTPEPTDASGAARAKNDVPAPAAEAETETKKSKNARGTAPAKKSKKNPKKALDFGLPENFSEKDFPPPQKSSFPPKAPPREDPTQLSLF